MLFSEDMMARLCQAMPLDTPIRIVDVGASNIARERPSYDPLLARSLGHLTAFEPNPVEYAKLPSGAQRRYLPYAIGDGHEAPFHVTLSPGLCSTLKPNTRITRHLKFLDRLSEVVSHETMLTHRLDDIAELGDIDFLKIDIQGGELKVFQGGRNRLANALCIQTEIAFVPIYEDQPLFADQDSMLQSLGLRFYGMASVNRFPMAGSSRKVRRKQRENDIGQWVDGDAVYLRDFTAWASLPADQLKRLFFILGLCFPAVGAALAVARLLVASGDMPQPLYARLEAELSG